MLRLPASDRRAIVALCCIAVFIIGVLFIVDAIKSNHVIIDNVEKEQALDEIESKVVDNGIIIEMKEFNPNIVDSLSLIKMGLSKRQVYYFLLYRSTGKVFGSVEDVAQTYGWSKSDIERLRPYMRFPNKAASQPVSQPPEEDEESKRNETLSENAKFRTMTKVDINEADSVTLCRIPGIGAKTASWIIGYRERIGGFYSTSQLLDIPIVSPDMVEWFVVSDSLHLHMLNINASSFRQLNLHPYVSYNQAKSIQNYKQLYGEIKDLEQLKATDVFSEEELAKLLPYLTF